MHGKAGPREVPPEVVKDLVERMRKIEGQARGIQRMLEENRPCEEVLRQLSAMRAGLSRVGMKAIGCHLGQTLTDEMQEGGSGQKAVEEVMDLFLKFS